MCATLFEMFKLTDLEDNHNFTLSDELNGAALAAVFGIQIITATVINSFVLIYTFCHPKILKQPSIIFLTNFIFVNLGTTILYLPFSVITATTGEWIIGNTVDEKTISCIFIGFLSSFNSYLTILTLTLMSVDRFLFIVKPLVYKAFMKTWVAILVDAMVWVVAGVFSIPPFFGFGQYSFELFGSNCFIVFSSNFHFFILSFVGMSTFLTIIAITTIWTYFFTRKYIKKFGDEPLNVKDDTLYKKRKRKLTGIFGTILIVTGICYGPLMITALMNIIIGFGNLPGQFFTASLFFLGMNYILNPIIQSYFRKDLNNFIVFYCRKIFGVCTCRCCCSESNTEDK